MKLGRNTVRIYPRPAVGNRQPGYLLADYTSGKRRQRWFTALKAARAEATRICALTAAGDLAGASMTGEDRNQLLRAQELVAPLGIGVTTAIELLVEAASHVGVHAVVAAAIEYAKRHPAARERVELSKAADEFYLLKQTKGRSSRHLSGIRSMLGRFVQEHPSKAVADFGTPTIQRWLDGLRLSSGAPASPQTRKNHALVLGNFFESARRRGVIAENPCRDLEKEKVQSDGDVDFWTPKEAEALLRHADPATVPALAVCMFAGVRTAEVCRLTWRAIDFDQGHVEVGSSGAKTRSRRLAPLLPNLREWLLTHRGKPDALIFNGDPSDPTAFTRSVTEAAERAGVRRLPNGSRHSFITYRAAQSGDVNRTSLEAGNSAAVIFKSYRGLATKAQAEVYFAITPKTPTPAD